MDEPVGVLAARRDLYRILTAIREVVNGVSKGRYQTVMDLLVERFTDKMIAFERIYDEQRKAYEVFSRLKHWANWANDPTVLTKKQLAVTKRLLNTFDPDVKDNRHFFDELPFRKEIEEMVKEDSRRRREEEE